MVMIVMSCYLSASENAQPVASGLVHEEHATIVSSVSEGSLE